MSAVFSRVSTGVATKVSWLGDGGALIDGPLGGTPDAVAVFATDPESMSSCVRVYVAVQVTSSPGVSATSSSAGHAMAGTGPLPVKSSSLTTMSARVTLPVFVTMNEY